MFRAYNGAVVLMKRSVSCHENLDGVLFYKKGFANGCRHATYNFQLVKWLSASQVIKSYLPTGYLSCRIKANTAKWNEVQWFSMKHKVARSRKMKRKAVLRSTDL